METNKALTTLDEIKSLGDIFVKSGFFADTRDASQAIVKILAGRELGLGPMASMIGVYIVNGKPALSANVMAAKVKASGKYDYRVLKQTAESCEIQFLQKDGDKWTPIGGSIFTLDDAKRAGTKNLDKFPRNMLFARAMSNGVRWFCPDITSGLTIYEPGELGAEVNENGEVIEAETKPAETPESAAPEPAPAQVDMPPPETAHLPPAPVIPSHSIPPKANDNGKTKRALLRTGLWKGQILDRAIEAGYIPDDSTGSGIRLLNVVGAAGISEVTDDNLTQAWQAVQAHYEAKKEKSAPPARGVPALSAVQRRKLVELYRNLNGGGEEEAYRGLDSLFIESCRHGLAEASYEEGAWITAQLLAAQRAR